MARIDFYHGPDGSRATVMWPPIQDVTDWYFHRTDKNKHVPARPKAMNGMSCKRCGVGKISKHYGVGHGSVPCRPLFLLNTYLFSATRLAASTVAGGLPVPSLWRATTGGGTAPTSLPAPSVLWGSVPWKLWGHTCSLSIKRTLLSESELYPYKGKNMKLGLSEL